MKAKKFTKETIAQIGVTPRKFPKFEIGDTVALSLRIQEGDKERIQVFQGDVIAIKNRGASSSFMVRKIAANSIAVERVFPYYSPLIESIQVVRKGKARRAKLYFLRDRVGKAARLREDVQKGKKAVQEQREAMAIIPEPAADVAQAQ